MKASGVFMYKGITQRDGGTFKNDKGEDVSYNSCMVLICDEIKEDGTGKERKFKFKDGQTALVNDFKSLETYTKVEIEFELALYNNRCVVTPVAFDIL